jgi:hypothetical protein
MKNILKVLILLLVCSVSQSATAQNSKLFLEPNKTYAKGRIYIKKSLIPISAKELMLTNDTILQYTDSESGLVKALPVSTSSINYVKIKTGTKAGAFALYGGLLMGLSAVYGVLSAEQQSLQEYDDTSGINWLPFIGGFTAGGALVGALIGAVTPKYRNFYIKDNYTTYTFKISPNYSIGGGLGIGMHVTF